MNVNWLIEFAIEPTAPYTVSLLYNHGSVTVSGHPCSCEARVQASESGFPHEETNRRNVDSNRTEHHSAILTKSSSILLAELHPREHSLTTRQPGTPFPVMAWHPFLSFWCTWPIRSFIFDGCDLRVHDYRVRFVYVENTQSSRLCAAAAFMHKYLVTDSVLCSFHFEATSVSSSVRFLFLVFCNAWDYCGRLMLLKKRNILELASSTTMLSN